jgi:hypothetical protein
MDNNQTIIDWKAIESTAPGSVIEIPEYSEWVCYLFGGKPDNGIIWRPLKGEHPNWFWRKMQYFCFGNKWVKDE